MLPGQVFQDATAYRKQPGNALIPASRGAEWALSHWSRLDVPRFTPQGVAIAPTVSVVVHQARWIAECPECAGAQLACRTDRRFFCTSCLNEHAGALWLRVGWPSDPAAIERALRPRMTVNCNWLPGETVADLLAENEEKGVSS